MFKKLRRLITYRRVTRVLLSYLYDFGRFIRYSSALGPWGDAEKLRATITANYHNIEKGLSLRSPRPGFGIETIKRLLGLINEYFDRFGSAEHLLIPVGALESYVVQQTAIGVDVAWLDRELKAIKLKAGVVGAPPIGGVLARQRAEVEAAVAMGGMEMLTSRSSCRQYSARPVALELLQAAARVAQRTPVVCNRQSGRIHYLQARNEIDRILAIQGGARGFANEVPLLLCVTVDLRNFNSAAERYQGWIDGGLFAMSLIFGLHTQGLATCCLNWSREAKPDREMRNLLSLHPAENIIMFIAVGHYDEEFSVAASVRKPLNEVLARVSLVA